MNDEVKQGEAIQAQIAQRETDQVAAAAQVPNSAQGSNAANPAVATPAPDAQTPAPSQGAVATATQGRIADAKAEPAGAVAVDNIVPSADEQNPEFDQLQRAVAAGKDISKDLDPTAAGQSGGGGGESIGDAVRFERGLDARDPTAGFDPDIAPASLINPTANTTPARDAGGPTPEDDVITLVPDDGIIVESGIPFGGSVISNDDFGLDGPGNPPVTAVNGDPNLVGVPISGSLGGTLTIFADGSYLYTPPVSVNHSDNIPDTESFTYTVQDSTGDTATATVTFSISDTVPTAVNDSNSITENNKTSITGNVLANDISDSAADVPLLFVSWGAETAQYGTITKNSDGTYSYSLNNNNPAVDALKVGQTLTETFTYTMSDSDGSQDSATLTITITGSNDAPIANADTNWAKEDTVDASGNVLQTLVHADAPSGTFGDVADTDVDVEALTVTGFTGGNAYGTLTLNADGSYSYVLNNSLAAVQALDDGETLTDTYTYTVTDGTTTDTATLTITIFGTNDAPVANADTNWAKEDTVDASGNVLQTLVHADAPSGTFGDVADTDVDVEALTVTTTGTFNGNYGTLVLNSDGSYTYTLYASEAAATAAGKPGAYDAVQARDTDDVPLTDSFNYTASDGTTTANSNLTISIFGTNDAPTLTLDAASKTVYESGLPTGTNAAATTETVTGSFTVADSDGLDDIKSLSVGGTTFTIGGGIGEFANLAAMVGQIVDTGYGKVTLTGYAAGVFSYSYRLDTTVDNDSQVGATLTSYNELFVVAVSDGTTSAQQTVTVAIVDDAPQFTIINNGLDAGTGVSISAPNPATNTTYFGQFADWQFGADGAQGTPTLSGVTGNVSIASSTSSSVILDLKDADGNLVAKVTLNADGTDSIEVFHRDPATETIPLLTTAVTASGPGVTKTIISGDLEVTVTADDGTSGTANDLVNPSAPGWGVDNNTIDKGESIKFAFSQAVNNFSFVTNGFTGSPSGDTVGLKITVYYSADMTQFEDFYLNVTSGQNVQIDDLLGFGFGDDNSITTIWAVNVQSNIDVVTNIDVQDSNDGFRLNDVSVTTTSTTPPADLDFNFTLNLVDQDGDTAAQSFSVHVDGDAAGGLALEAIAGTSGADVLTGTSLADVIIGGAGDDIITGGLGADTFKWLVNETGVDTITDFNKSSGVYNAAEGDVLDLKLLLDGETGTASNLTSFLDFSLSGSDTVIKIDVDGSNSFASPDQTIILQGVDLVTGYADQTAIINALLPNLVTDA
jgi:VCBS repeat-containing protein